MRMKLVFLLLILVAFAIAYDPVKTADKDKALAYKNRKEKAQKAVLTKDEDEEDIPEMSLDDVEKDAGVEDEDEEEEEEPKKKVPKKQKPKDKKVDSRKKKQEKSKKSKKADTEITAAPEETPIPNMTSFDFLGLSREHRLNQLRDIIKNTPNGDIEKMRQITDELKEEMDVQDDNNEYQACSGTADELCHCDLDEINCSSIIMDMDDPHLHTADLAIQKKDFVPVIANLSENYISRLQKGKVLPEFEKYVANLDVSHNQLRFLDSDVFKPFTNLSKLDLSHNNLQTIKKPVFATLKNTLHRLDLGFNRIKSLPDNVFEELVNLKKLVLDGNPIKNWKKEMFKGLDNLEEISLDRCNIDDLPADIFAYLPKLRGVSLRENPLEEIPAVVAQTKTLKFVDMSITNLTEIRDHAFAGDSDLEEIYLEKMPFLSVVRDCGFCGLPKLKILWLNDNSQLMELHPNSFGFIKSDPGHKASSISTLALQNSNMSILSEHMMYYDKLESFKIGGNQWNCNCETQFLLEEKFMFKEDSVAPKCTYPKSLEDRHLVTVRVTEACESARFLGRSGRFSSVLGLALLAGFIAIGGYYMFSSGKLEKLVRRVKKEPEVSYTNLQSAGEDFALETDFQPRPAEV